MLVSMHPPSAVGGARLAASRLCCWLLADRCVVGCANRSDGRSFNQRFPDSAHDCYPQCRQAIGVICSYNMACWQHRVIWGDVRGVLCCLLDGFHLFLASGVVKWTYDDWLS